MWVTSAVAVLALLVGGLSVLTWAAGRPQMSGSGTTSTAESSTGAVPSVGGNAYGSGADSGARAAPEDTSAAGPAAPAVGTDPGSFAPPPGTAVQRSLVRTAQLSIDVTESAAATRQVRTVAAAAGGLVVEERSSERGSWLVLRVPADAMDRVIDDIAAFGRVTGRSSQVVDSTADVVDLDARVASQQASVARVRTLLAQAVSIGDIVSIESELASREADLDSLTGRLAALKDQVALSTLTVDLRSPSTLPADDADDRAVGFLDGLETGWRGVLALGSATAAVLGFVLPFVPVLAVVAGLGWWARRLIRGRRVVVGGRSDPGSVGES